MRKLILYTVFFCVLGLWGQSQDEKPGEGRLQSLEIAYLTKELNLSPEEAQKFWPLYNQYANEMRDAFKNRKKGDVLDSQQQLLDVRKKYRNEFLKILSQERVNKFFNAENKFRDMIRRELQQRQLQKQQLNPRKRGG
jgi:hypothetical protein